MNKKLTVTIIAVLALVLIIGIIFFNSNKPAHTDNVTNEQDTTDTSLEDEISIESIGELSYKILRNEVDGDKVYFDIYSENNLTDEQIKTIGKEVYKHHSKNNTIKHVYFNYFNDENAFPQTLEEDYDNYPIKGLVTNYISTHSDEKNTVELKRYLSFYEDTSFEFDKTDYNVVDALKTENHADVHVVISEVPEEDVWDTGKGFNSLIKNLNPGTETIKVFFYFGDENYQNKKVAWTFDSKYPSFLVSSISFTF